MIIGYSISLSLSLYLSIYLYIYLSIDKDFPTVYELVVACYPQGKSPNGYNSHEWYVCCNRFGALHEFLLHIFNDSQFNDEQINKIYSGLYSMFPPNVDQYSLDEGYKHTR